MLPRGPAASCSPANSSISRSAGSPVANGARVLIAKLMLQPADVLLLDEPTNDLDIPTLEVLEESLLEFRGALVLVTHDRYLLDRVSTTVIGLEGLGGAGRFADYSQWETWQRERESDSRTSAKILDRPPEAGVSPAAAGIAKKKLSYLEAREYATLEARIAEAEGQLKAAHAAYADPAIASDAERLIAAQGELSEAQERVDELYQRWEELEAKIT